MKEKVNYMEDIFSEMYDKCNKSDMVLIGIGEEFQYNWDILLKNQRYREIEQEINEEMSERSGNEKEASYKWIIPFLQKMALDEWPDRILDEAYKKLEKITVDTNYFIITTVMDDYIYRYNFNKERVVTPCGGFRKMQCDINCSNVLTEPDDEAYKKVKLYFNKEISLKELKKPICEVCGSEKRFNQIGVSKYAENGYLPQWEIYTKWLQGTVNKKTCVIELGTGMYLPSIIRWPFEKIVYYNKKAFLYRIHASLYQMEKEISDRGIGIKENSVKFLANGFVK